MACTELDQGISECYCWHACLDKVVAFARCGAIHYYARDVVECSAPPVSLSEWRTSDGTGRFCHTNRWHRRSACDSRDCSRVRTFNLLFMTRMSCSSISKANAIDDTH